MKIRKQYKHRFGYPYSCKSMMHSLQFDYFVDIFLGDFWNKASHVEVSLVLVPLQRHRQSHIRFYLLLQIHPSNLFLPFVPRSRVQMNLVKKSEFNTAYLFRTIFNITMKPFTNGYLPPSRVSRKWSLLICNCLASTLRLIIAKILRSKPTFRA